MFKRYIIKRLYKPKRRPFFFKDLTHQDMVELLNKKCPISLKNNEDLVNRIHDKYPLIDKSKIAMIVKMAFQGFREALLLSKLIFIKNLCNYMGMLFRMRKRKTLSVKEILTRFNVSTPLTMRQQYSSGDDDNG